MSLVADADYKKMNMKLLKLFCDFVTQRLKHGKEVRLKFTRHVTITQMHVSSSLLPVLDLFACYFIIGMCLSLFSIIIQRFIANKTVANIRPEGRPKNEAQ